MPASRTVAVARRPRGFTWEPQTTTVNVQPNRPEREVRADPHFLRPYRSASPRADGLRRRTCGSLFAVAVCAGVDDDPPRRRKTRPITEPVIRSETTGNIVGTRDDACGERRPRRSSRRTRAVARPPGAAAAKPGGSEDRQNQGEGAAFSSQSIALGGFRLFKRFVKDFRYGGRIPQSSRFFARPSLGRAGDNPHADAPPRPAPRSSSRAWRRRPPAGAERRGGRKLLGLARHERLRRPVRPGIHAS